MHTSDSLSHPESSARPLLLKHQENAAAELASPTVHSALKQALLVDSQADYKRGNYEAALDKFTHVYAMMEAENVSGTDDTFAAVVSNIGCCLHQLGEPEAAQVYYERAIQMFEKVPVSTLDWLLYGNVNQRRVEYIKARLVELGLDRKPDASQYLDGVGRRQAWSESERSGREQGLWSWFSPSSWYQYATLADAKREGGEQAHKLNADHAGTQGPSAA